MATTDQSVLTIDIKRPKDVDDSSSLSLLPCGLSISEITFLPQANNMFVTSSDDDDDDDASVAVAAVAVVVVAT